MIRKEGFLKVGGFAVVCGFYLWKERLHFSYKIGKEKCNLSSYPKHERTVCCTAQIQSLNLWGLLCVLSPVRYLLVR